MVLKGKPALFLDRDGVLNEEVNYLHDPRDLVIIPGVARVIADFNRQAIPVVVVTNQAGIGRGYYDSAAYAKVNQAMALGLAEDHAHIDAWYFCPHRPDENCACRKPRPGMLLSAAADLAIDPARSTLVGDKLSDVGAARAVGANAILVRTGHGRRDEQTLLSRPELAGQVEVFDSLPAAHGALAAWFGFARVVSG
jgi:D-glycero-D-manno-heptose 1,7-bisphosphate phosphatase